MGLFNRKKESDKASDASLEFERDIRELLARKDIQCRQDVCNAEYSKALSLLEGSPSGESVFRAYNIMGNLAVQFDYIPAFMWMGDFAEHSLHKDSEAVFWYKKAAEAGDGNGARCYADMLMVGKGVETNRKLAIQFYARAAEKGIPEAAFVIGEFLRSVGDTEGAIQAYMDSLAGGYSPAAIRLEQMGAGKT